MQNTAKLVYTLIVVFITAFLCSYLNKYGMENFYYALMFPPLVPPSFVFPIAWTLIYSLMIVSFFIVSVKSTPEEFKNCNFWFLGQLLLHVLWTYSFFYAGAIGIGAIILLLLCYNVYKMIKEFYGVDKFAAYLQYPYALWVLFATYMNIGFVYYNGTFIL